MYCFGGGMSIGTWSNWTVPSFQNPVNRNNNQYASRKLKISSSIFLVLQLIPAPEQLCILKRYQETTCILQWSRMKDIYCNYSCFTSPTYTSCQSHVGITIAITLTLYFSPPHYAVVMRTFKMQRSLELSPGQNCLLTISKVTFYKPPIPRLYHLCSLAASQMAPAEVTMLSDLMLYSFILIYHIFI